MKPVGAIGYAAVGLISVLLAACTSAQDGTAQAAPDDTPSSPAAAVPTVTAPLPVDKLVTDPCALLTRAQLSALGVTDTTTQPDKTAVMTGCGWSDVGAGVQLNIDWVTPLRHGLTDVYAQRGSAAYWEPATISGYPAVVTDTTDERSQGTCRLDLGATNTAVVDVAYQGSAGSDPCSKVKALAAAVVASLKGEP